MNINEFARCLWSRETTKVKQLFEKLECEVSCYEDDIDHILNIIANDGDVTNTSYNYSELIEWLNDDSDAYIYVNDLIANSYSSFYDLLEAAKHLQDQDCYDEIYPELESLLDKFNEEHDGDNNECDEEEIVIEDSYNSILSKL